MLHRHFGITPTRVGKTCLPSRWHRVTPDHPHACGENAISLSSCLMAFGSPPRVWGKRVGDIVGVRANGITPTRVGKTGHGEAVKPGITDHPHACGENLPTPSSRRSDPGSPPRVWGKPGALFQRHWFGRITPTRVGKTRQS